MSTSEEEGVDELREEEGRRLAGPDVLLEVQFNVVMAWISLA